MLHLILSGYESMSVNVNNIFTQRNSSNLILLLIYSIISQPIGLTLELIC
jgi:hypothetical protein